MHLSVTMVVKKGVDQPFDPNTIQFFVKFPFRQGQIRSFTFIIHLTYTNLDYLTLLLHISSLLHHLPLTHAISELVVHSLITVKQSFDLNVPKDRWYPKSVTFEIHHGGYFTPTPSRSYIGGHVSSVNVPDIDDFCLHDLKDMVVKLGYGVADLMYFYFLRPRLGLDYDTRIFVTHKKGVAIAVDNHLRKGLIEIDSSPDVNRNLTPMCHRNLTKEWEHVSSKTLSIGDYANTGEEITLFTGDDIHGKQMVVFNCRNYTSGSDSEDLDYDPKHDEVFDADEHIVKDVHVSMNNFNFNADPRHCGIDSEGRNQLRVYENKQAKILAVQYMYYFYLGYDLLLGNCGLKGKVSKHSLVPYVASDIDMSKNVFSQTKGGPVIRENNISGKQNILGKGQTVKGKDGRVVQDQMQKQFDVGVLKMKAFRAKRIATNKMTGKSLTRTFRRVYVCLGALKQGFRACSKEILRLDGCFMSAPSIASHRPTQHSASQPNAASSIASQGPNQYSVGPSQGFQAPRPAPKSGPQRLTKKIARKHNPRKFSS
ncbi:hypothetical protein Tco_0122421 [Tanacetum coccineum]